MVKPLYCCVIIFYLLKFQVVFGLENSNFILIRNSNKKEHVDYRFPSEEDENQFVKIANKLKGINSNFCPLFLFYKEQGTGHQIISNMFVLNKDKIYLYSENKKMNFLGVVIDSTDKILTQLKESVFNGKLVAAYWKKKDLPVSILVDDKGLVYSVSRETSKDISIETIGLTRLQDSNIH